MKTIWITFGAILVFVGGVGIFLSIGQPDIAPVPRVVKGQELSSVPDLIFKDYDGNDVSTTSLLGKPYIMNTWATWCPFCVQELKDFVILQEELGDSVTVIAVNRAEGLKVSKTYTDSQGTTNQMTFLLDEDDAFYRSVGGFSMPETIFVNEKGEIVFHKRGFMRLTEMKEIVSDLFSINL